MAAGPAYGRGYTAPRRFPDRSPLRIDPGMTVRDATFHNGRLRIGEDLGTIVVIPDLPGNELRFRVGGGHCPGEYVRWWVGRTSRQPERYLRTLNME